MKRLFSSLLLLLSCSSLLAQESPVVLGVTKKMAVTGKALSEYCTPQESKIIPQGQVVFVIARKVCAPKYLSPESFYEIAWRGEVYFIKLDDLFLEPDKVAKLEASTQEEDARKARDASIEMSLVSRRIELEKIVDTMESLKPKGLAIIDWSVIDESEYTKGTGLRIQPFNPTEKTIKYIWFTVQALNPVDDPVGAPVTVRAVGPLEPDTSGTYRFEYTWMTDLVDSAKLRQIRVQYMDGTQRTIQRPDDIILDKNMSQIYNEL